MPTDAMEKPPNQLSSENPGRRSRGERIDRILAHVCLLVILGFIVFTLLTKLLR